MSSNKEIYNKILEGVDDNIVFTSLLSYLPVHPRKYNTASYGPGLRPKETPEDRLFPNKEERLDAVEHAGCVAASGHPPFPYGSPSGSVPNYWLETNPTKFPTSGNPSGVSEDPVDKARRLAWEAAGRPSINKWFRPSVDDVLDYKRGVCGVGLSGWPPTDVYDPKTDFGPNFPARPPQDPVDPPRPERPKAPDVPQIPAPPPVPKPPAPEPDPELPPNKPPAPPAPQDPPTGTFDPPTSPNRPQDPDQPAPPSVVYAINSSVVSMPDPITDPLTLSGGFYSSIRRIDIHASKRPPNMYHGWIAPGDYLIESARAESSILDDGANLRTNRCISGFNAHSEVNYTSIVDNMYLGGSSINEYHVPGAGKLLFPTREEGSGGDVVGSPLRDGNLSNGYSVIGLGTSISKLNVNYIPLSFTQRRHYRRAFTQHVMTHVFGYSRRSLRQSNGDFQKGLLRLKVYFEGTIFYYVLPKIDASRRIKIATYQKDHYRTSELIGYTSKDKTFSNTEIKTASFKYSRTIEILNSGALGRHSRPPQNHNNPIGTEIKVLEFNTDHILPVAINRYTTYVIPEWYS
jgi:hypothetical protein